MHVVADLTCKSCIRYLTMHIGCQTAEGDVQSDQSSRVPEVIRGGGVAAAGAGPISAVTTDTIGV
jgi:hypothetical protein